MRWLSTRVEPFRSLLSGRPRLLTSLVVLTALSFFFVAGWLAWFSYDITAGLPGRKEIRAVGDMAQSTTIYDAANAPVFTIYKERRIEVPLGEISPFFVKAVLSVEDQRFYDHQGIDAFRIAAAFRRNLSEGRRAEGGSTITQQLARQSFLNNDKTYRRKIKEVILAGYLEAYFDKDEILELYLNKVYFGEGFYGVEAAARGYFAKSAADLDLGEAALLAGLIKSPSTYAPTEHLDRALTRRAVVLEMMTKTGAIDEATAAKVGRAPVRLKNGLPVDEKYGLYFKEYVRQDLIDRFGWDRVYEGGLRVYTTLDSQLQQAAEELVERGLRDIERRGGFDHTSRERVKVQEGQAPEYLQAALVSIDPATGYVRALVGGRDFQESRFNRAVQAKRQSGSAFKPFVFAAALEAGYSPASVIANLNDPTATIEGPWVPEDGHSSASSMTLRAALKTSSNRAAVQLLNAVGIPRAVEYAQRLNVGTPPSVPSLALGASEVSLLSLTSAYGTFAAGGVLNPPVVIRRIEDRDGNVLFEAAPQPRRAVSESTAFLMSSMLADVINGGTGYRARQVGFTVPAAGKTGTTNDFVDAWFVGYTPHIVTGVWVGFDTPRTIVNNGYAGELAVPIWASFMRRASRGDRPDWFAQPQDVVGATICRVSGQLPNAGCGSVASFTQDGFYETQSTLYTEYFAKGTEPKSLCPIHTAPPTYYSQPTEPDPNVVDPEPPDLPPAGTAGTPAPNLPPVEPGPVKIPPRPPNGNGTGRGGGTNDDEAPPPEVPARSGWWSRLFGSNGQPAETVKQKPEPTRQKPPVKKKPDG